MPPLLPPGDHDGQPLRLARRDTHGAPSRPSGSAWIDEERGGGRDEIAGIGYAAQFPDGNAMTATESRHRLCESPAGRRGSGRSSTRTARCCERQKTCEGTSARRQARAQAARADGVRRVVLVGVDLQCRTTVGHSMVRGIVEFEG